MRSLARRHQHVTALGLSKPRVKNDCRERRQNPRPWPQRVVREVKPQYRQQPVSFVLSAEDPLRDISSAARFRAGIPEGPPLHRQMHDEGDHRQRPQSFAGEAAGKIRQKSRDVACSGSGRSAPRRKRTEHLLHAPRGMHAVPSHSNYDRHLQHELKQIRPKYAPQSAQRNVDPCERHQEENADRQRLSIAHPQRRTDDVHHGLRHPAKDQTVHQQPEVDSAEPAKESGRLAGVAHLRELHVGNESRTAPQTREQEHRHHSRRQKTPP